MKYRTLPALVAIAALAGCGDDPTGADLSVASEVVTADVALMAAEATLEELDQAAVLMDSPHGDRHHQGERDVTVAYYDADGNAQSAYDELTTAMIVRSASWSRSFTRGDVHTATMEGSREQTVTGLEGEEDTRTVNGAGTTHVSRSRYSDENGTRSYEMTSASTWTDVVHGVPRDEYPYPLSGSITRSVEVVIVNGPNGDATRSRTVVIEFDGTRYATMTVDGETFEIDLGARDGDAPVRHRRP